MPQRHGHEPLDVGGGLAVVTGDRQDPDRSGLEKVAGKASGQRTERVDTLLPPLRFTLCRDRARETRDQAFGVGQPRAPGELRDLGDEPLGVLEAPP